MVAFKSLDLFVVVFAVLGVSQGTYVLQIQAVSYSTTDACCDIFCGTCDNQFDFCLRNRGTSQDGNTGNCPLGSYQTGEIDGSSFTFGSNLGGGVSNPMTFTGSVWPGEVQLYIRVTDLDLVFHDHVDDIYAAIRASPSSSYSSNQAFNGNQRTATVTLRYRVTCSANYYGSNCATNCVGRDDSNGHYTCGSNGEVVCRSGWTGPATNCITPICASECDTTGGYCTRPGECRCRSGWTGDNCDQCVPASGCSSTGGYCTLPGQCICRTGYIGGNCETDAVPCERSSPCRNGASCINDRAGGYSCVCLPGFTGGDCGQDINECEPNPCLNQGRCRNLVNNFTCECSPGWEGRNCEENIDECLSAQCLHGATCEDLVNGYNCSCASGFYGLHCETEIDECFPQPCINQGTCVDEVNDYSCQCLPDFTGNDCEIDLNMCRSDPCQNGGTCTNVFDSFSCSCPPKYTGRKCNEEILFCSSTPCENFGTCLEELDGYSCTCFPNTTGENCDQKVEDVKDKPSDNKAEEDKQSGLRITTAAESNASSTGTIVSGILSGLVLIVVIILLVIFVLILITKRKGASGPVYIYQKETEALDNPTYMSQKWEAGRGAHTVPYSHYEYENSRRFTTTDSNDYATVDEAMST